MVALTGSFAPPASAHASAVQKLCVTAFPSANSTTKGGTTLYNRQASVQAVACNGFGFDVRFHVDGGIVCALLSAAIGQKYEKYALFLDGSCSAGKLAAQHDVGTVSGEACGMLSDLLAVVPWAKAYAVGAGVACAFGKPLGSWIESESERQAAKGVIGMGRCLRFVTHSFPLTDTWSAVKCRKRDRRFSTLSVGKGSAPAKPTKVISLAPVDANYQPRPGLRVIDGGLGTCEAGSDSVGNAYRCFAGNHVYDPCWTDNVDPSVPAVLCQYSPWGTTVTRLTDTEGGLMPFFSPPPQPLTSMEPWAIELTSGERCVAAQGAHAGFDGARYIVDYGCVTQRGRAENRVLLRGVVRSHRLWTIRSATYNKSYVYKLGPTVRIATAWYATQDLGDQLAAAANSCSASALAFTAAAYEEANHEPDGALPDITRQACSGGYAILVFRQNAPSPGYEASMAFQATASGWMFLGEADHIQQGEFGIPDDAYNQIMSQLSSEGDTESVPF